MSTKSRARACDGKIRNPDRAAAEEQLRRWARLSGADPARYAVYRCRHCHHWHIGHRPKRG